MHDGRTKEMWIKNNCRQNRMDLIDFVFGFANTYANNADCCWKYGFLYILGWYRMDGNEKMGKVVFAGYMLFWKQIWIIRIGKRFINGICNIFIPCFLCILFVFVCKSISRHRNDESLHSGLDIFTGVILGPLVEEWIFRGILWSKLKSYGEGFAILATTILFAIMHGQGLLLIFLLIGFFSGVLVCLTGNLWYAIIFHVIHNMGIFLWENKLFSFSMNMVLTMLLNAGLFLMLLILLLLCSKKNILLHLYYCKKKLLEKIISEKSRLVVFFNTAGIMSFVFYFGVSWLISLVSFGLNL